MAEKNLIEQAFEDEQPPEIVPVGDVSSSAQINELATAMVAIQGEMPILTREQHVDAGRAGNWNYTPLETIWEAYQPIAAKNGVWTQWIPTRHGDMMGGSLRLTHRSGQWFQSPVLYMSVNYPWDKDTNSIRKTPRAEASCLSYIKRYLLEAVVGIVTARQDDDADAASGEKSTITPPRQTPASAGTCPECGKALKLRAGKRGDFYGCSGYPTCKYTRDAAAEPPDGQIGTSPQTNLSDAATGVSPTDEPERKKLRAELKRAGNAAGLDDTALSVWIKGMGHNTQTCSLDTIQGCINLLPVVSKEYKDWLGLTDGMKDAGNIVNILNPDATHFLQLRTDDREAALTQARLKAAKEVPF